MAVSSQRPNPASSMRHGSTATSSSQVPPSAPVLEFRCMFTHDIFKKQKKWHDGVAKYHTFNKKVMVYDDSRNLVGGVHYRDPEEFCEGLEIKLDRPVLVQVEDQLGESTTDLTPLINRPGANNTSNSNTQSLRPLMSRLPGPNLQIKPKSIKELLAGSQGHMRRAGLPAQSPFEQRQVLNEIQSNVRLSEPQIPPAKRRKLATREVIEPETSKTPTDKRPMSGRSQPRIGSCVHGDPEVVRDAVNISSDDEPIMAKDKVRIAEPKPRPPKGIKDQGEKARRQASPLRGKSPEPLVTEISRQKETRPVSSSAHTTARPVSASSIRGPFSSNTSDLAPRSSLKFSSQKSRPKLMYKALLIGTPAFLENDRSLHFQDHDENSFRPSRVPARKVQNSLLETDSFFASSQLRPATMQNSNNVPAVTRMEPNTESAAHVIPEKEGATASEDAAIAHSPLFLSQQVCLSSQRKNHSIDNDDPGLFLVDIQNVPNSSPDTTSHGKGEDEVVENRREEEDNTRADSPCPLLPSVPVSKGATTTNKPTSPHDTKYPMIDRSLSALAFSSPTESRSTTMQASAHDFRRVLSESAAITHSDDPRFSENEISDDESFFEIGHHKATNSNPVGPAEEIIERDPGAASEIVEPTSLPETRSLNGKSPAALGTVRLTTKNTEIAPQAKKHTVDMGPWTTRESFLLFDWWPQNRQKPDYGQGAGSMSISTHMMMNDDHEDVSNSIASRGMSKKYGTFGSARFVSQR